MAICAKKIFIKIPTSNIFTFSRCRKNFRHTRFLQKLKLKPNVTLPKTRKCYFHAPLEVKQLKEIKKVLTRLDIISKASISGSKISMFA